MMKRSPIAVLLIACVCLGQRASAAKPANLTFDTYSGYFVSNKFQPKAAASFVVIQFVENGKPVKKVEMAKENHSEEGKG